MEDDIGRHLRLFGEFLAQRAQRLEQGIAHRVGGRIAAAAPLALGRHNDRDRALAGQDRARRAAQRQSAMFGRDQIATRLQGAGQWLEQSRFLALDDPEDAQPVVPALAHALVLAPRQHLLQMAHAEALPRAVYRPQQLARQFGDIGHARLFEAIVAIAAALGRVLAEMAQQHRAAAGGGLDQPGKRIEPGALGIAARLVDFGQPLPRGGEIARTPEHHRLGRIAVAPRAPGFLVIALDRLGYADMRDETHVGFVDPHAEGDRGDDDHVLAGHECRLVGSARPRIEPRVIGQHRAPGGSGQLVRQILHLAPRRGVDDPRSRRGGHQIGQLAHRIVAVANGIADIGPVESRQHQPVIGDAQLRHHVAAGLLVGGGGQRQPRNLRKGIEHAAQHPVIGAEIMPPFRHAMRLVDREQAQRRRAQQVTETRLAGTFGRDIEQIELARAEGILRLAPVGIGAGQRGRADAVGARAAQLVVHQRDQRADHHAGAGQHDRGELVGQRLARPRRHHRQRRIARQYACDHFFLPPAEAIEAEGLLQRLSCVRNPGHARLMAEGTAHATGRGRFSPCPAPRGCALPARPITGVEKP